MFTMGDFAKLGLKKEILEVLSKLKYKKSFEVQEKVVPLAIQGKNVVFTSRTGSGKTLAYLLGFLGKINKKLGPQMIVLVPTRELCIQVGKEMSKIGELLGINVGMLYGGRDVPGDYRTLSRKNQIIVGTPGRLLLHVDEKKIKVGEVKYLVYDESDQMFDNGFFDDCIYMKERVSRDAQVIFSSATLTEQITDFIENVIIDYELLKIGELIPKNIVQEKLYCEKLEKNELLLDIFTKKKFKRAMIFCNTKVKSYDICEYLKENKFNAKSLNSDLRQEDRLNHLNLFKDGKIRILVTTDVAARGLHIEKVDIIINYDVPTREEFYVHRIGRTGRIDKKGYSLTFICPEDVDRFYNIEFEYELKVKEIEKNSVMIKKKD
ncbi:DEAD/DEAH box helicase [Candidatus Woesearchaeota archaeon]|jgi:ATP-dependent RNA helicase DeaD|nr:DEAD/DEAH box helicase [Candidatus Woesearchaeota archaeon]